MLFFLCILILLVFLLLLPLYTCLHISTPFDDEIDDLMQEEFLKKQKLKDAE